MNKVVNFSDGLVTKETLDIQNSTGFNTEIMITAKNCRHNGSIEKQILHNQTVLPGRTQLLENVFPVKPDVENQHIFLNDNVLGEIDINTGLNATNVEVVKLQGLDDSKLPRNNPDLFRRRKVAYWCAGDGAVNRTVLSQAYSPHSTNSKLYHMIPFIVTDDLSSINKSLYKFIVRYSANHPLANKYGAYFKKIEFDNLNGINMIVDKVLYNPSWGDTAPDLNAETPGYVNKFKGDKTQLNYIDLKLNVTSSEFKDWFQLMDGTVANATISEIGLVTGFDGYLKQDGTLGNVEDLRTDDPFYSSNSQGSEVLDAELFSHLTFDPYSVSRENNTLEIGYRIYS
jgi:hypothetical protein